ncbi:MAG: arsenate reductase family protein [Bdellovibrionales bacterium]|nr:arsenate reductase family protein [Bdellovibrionales bacterium]
MKKLRVYEYSGCSTCKKALGYLKKKGVAFEAIPIVDEPPTMAELKRMLAYYDGKIGKLFNTSGLVYRELGLGEKLKSMSEADALKLLAANGKLVKRPFLLGDGFGHVGFKEDEWKKDVR